MRLDELQFSLALLAVCVCATLAGCIAQEAPVAPYNRGGVLRGSVTLGPDYGACFYYDLETGMVARAGRITDWDLGVRRLPGTPCIVLNSSTVMAAYDAGAVNFEAVTTTVGAPRYDAPSGAVDSTAIGQWWKLDRDSLRSRGHVYVIDRGVDEAGRKRGYAKVRVERLAADTLWMRIAALDGANDRVVAVAIDPWRTLTTMSLASGVVVEAEPPSEQWDILFTRYTTLFHSPMPTSYSVTGALLNTDQTVAAVDSVTGFAAITSADVGRYSFSGARDGIGYAWKTYDLNKGIYTVNAGITYIIRTSTGFYYKLHFVDFYGSTGQKGTPAFEYQKL